MASIPEHIKNLLFEQDCVVVPDFGGFITNFHGAVVREQDALILPPRKRVAFNEVLKFDDGLLTSYIAFKEGRSREEIRTKIRLFTEQAWRELRLRSSFRFEHLGSFTLNAEGKLVFEPDNRNNFFGESFGMAPVSLRLHRSNADAPVASLINRTESVQKGILEVVPEEVTHEETIPLNSRQRWLTFPSVAASTAVLLLSLIGWIWFDGGNSTLSSLNPFSMLNFSEWKKKPTPPSVMDMPVPRMEKVAVKPTPAFEQPRTESEKPPVLETASVASVAKPVASREAIRSVLVVPMRISTDQGKISAEPGRYFIVAGGFGKMVNAQRLQKQLQSQGFANATLLYPMKSRLIRVAAQEFETAQEARRAAVESRGVLGDHVWVLKTK